MPTISNDKCTVLIVCDLNPDDRDEVIELAKGAMPIFAKQPGFISASLHVSERGDRFIQYLQWESVEDHQACQTAEDWKVPAGMNFWKLIEAGMLKIDPQIYSIEHVAQ